MKNELEDKIYHIIAKNTEGSFLVGEINNDVNLNDLGINSITFIKILVEIETEFYFEFKDEELNFDNERFQTVQSLINLIREKIATD